MNILRFKKANYYRITLRTMTSEDILKFEEIKKRKDKEINKLAIFVMFGLMVLVALMILLYNLNLQ